MDALKKMLELPGIKNLTTYIQSGNLIFDSAGEKEALGKKIEKKLLATLGYEVTTIIRTIPEIAEIIKRNPFGKPAEDMALHVSFLSGVPEADAVKQLLSLQNELEQFV